MDNSVIEVIETYVAQYKARREEVPTENKLSYDASCLHDLTNCLAAAEANAARNDLTNELRTIVSSIHQNMNNDIVAFVDMYEKTKRQVPREERVAYDAFHLKDLKDRLVIADTFNYGVRHAHRRIVNGINSHQKKVLDLPYWHERFVHHLSVMRDVR